MVAANAYRGKSATFAGSAILGIEDIQISQSGSPTDHSTDASPTITAVFVDQIVTEVTITTSDLNRSNAIEIGATGSLVCVMQKRAEGKGDGAADETATMATATCTGHSPSMPTNGKGTVTLTFRCSGPNGTSPVVWS